MEGLLQNLKEDRLQRNGEEEEDVRACSSEESGVNRGAVAEMCVSHLETMKMLQSSRAVGRAPKFSGAVGWTSQSGGPLAVRHCGARLLTKLSGQERLPDVCHSWVGPETVLRGWVGLLFRLPCGATGCSL